MACSYAFFEESFSAFFFHPHDITTFEALMPTIAFVSPKGGAGKTTSALVLSSQIAARGTDATIIDADPNRPLRTWGEGGGVPEKLTIISNPKPFPPDREKEADPPGVLTRVV